MTQARGPHQCCWRSSSCPCHLSYDEGMSTGVTERCCRDFKKVTPAALLMAVNAKRLSGVFKEDDRDKITKIRVAELEGALDLIAPLKQILIKDKQTPLYLRRETREIMATRDAAAGRKDWQLYRHLWNLATRHVRKDRVASNLALFGDWRLADSLTGQGRSGGLSLLLEQYGQLVKEDDKLADVMNRHYICNIEKIWEKIKEEKLLSPGLSPPPLLSSVCSSKSASSSPFTLRPPTAWEVRKAIGKLKNTPALGEDGIPTGVIKDLAQVLADPLSHLVDRSIAAGRVPAAFKTANVVPIYKRGKDPSQPSSYRPVVILCALSKVLESLVVGQLVPFLVRRLPTEQWGIEEPEGLWVPWGQLTGAGQEQKCRD